MIKLNIQRFGHTNSTSNYELPQFIGTDKPQWLTDINQAFASIDTAIHAVSVLANLNSTKIGDLTDLTTDNKIDLVSAINEVDSHTDSNTNTIAGHTTAISANTTAIGDITDLDTVDKANLVSAINEVDLLAKNNKVEIGTLSNLDTVDKTTLVNAINEIVGLLNINNFDELTNIEPTMSGIANLYRKDLTLAYNDNFSLVKFYGYISYESNSYGSHYIIPNAIPANKVPDSDITVKNLGIVINNKDQTFATRSDITFKHDRSIDINVENGTNDGTISVQIPPCVLFMKNFGDTPVPPQN